MKSLIFLISLALLISGCSNQPSVYSAQEATIYKVVKVPKDYTIVSVDDYRSTIVLKKKVDDGKLYAWYYPGDWITVYEPEDSGTDFLEKTTGF